MKTEVEAIIPIDLRLRFVLYGIECIFGIEMSSCEANRVFEESRVDHVNARDYVFFERSELSISGRVDAYEPETLRLKIETSGNRSIDLPGMVEKSEYHVHRFRSFERED